MKDLKDCHPAYTLRQRVSLKYKVCVPYDYWDMGRDDLLRQAVRNTFESEPDPESQLPTNFYDCLTSAHYGSLLSTSHESVLSWV